MVFKTIQSVVQNHYTPNDSFLSLILNKVLSLETPPILPLNT